MKTTDNKPLAQGTRINAKINGAWFKSRVVKDNGATVRVEVFGDCDREIPRGDIELRNNRLN